MLAEIVVSLACLLFLFYKYSKNVGRFGSVEDIRIHGSVSPGYESVRDMFEENFKKGSEINAQLCVYVKERKVVDLWGTATNDESFNGDTLVNVFSSTKSLTAIVVARMVEKGLIGYANKIAQYWRQFGGYGGREGVAGR